MALSLWRHGLRRLLPQTSLQTINCQRNSSNEPDGNLLTIKEVRDQLVDMVGKRPKWGVEPKIEQNQVMQAVAKSQDDLPKRKPSDSFVRAYIPLSQAQAREKYMTHDQGIRYGRLLEDFDTLAGYICYHHNKDPKLGDDQKSPYAFVTVLVDRIEQHPSQPQISSLKDIYLCGNVTWVGKSSMECTMHMDQEIEGKIQRFLTAKYLFVARNPATNTAGFVSPLDPQTLEEKAAFQLGEENRRRRQEEGKKSLLKSPPSEQERLLIHELFLDSIDQQSGSLQLRYKPENSVWMQDTILKSLIICHPEQRNLYNKIFGGFLMMKAYELAWSTVSIYTNSRPGMCKIVDDILFKKPVEIGSLLFISSQIVYTNGPDVQVHVHAQVVNPLEGTNETTNDFHFTFDTGLPSVPKVMPKTYAEAMMYLVGKRHYES